MSDDVMSDTPVLDTLASMTLASVENSTLSPRELMLVRLAALVAVDAPAASYLMNTGVALDVGITLDDAQNVLIGVAPVVGAPRVVSAAGRIGEALGVVIATALAEAELEAELEADEDEQVG